MQEHINDTLLAVYTKKRRGRAIWKNILSVMICAVVFITTYALILPAITQETKTFCGLEEHTHEEACYAAGEAALVCGLEETEGHAHTDACWLPAHTHTDDCYTASDAALTCGETETESHTHDAACYVTEQNLVCGTEESTGHSHGSSCYSEQVTTQICGLEESEEHAHSDACYTTTGGDLICLEAESIGHAHDDACYATTETLTCEQAEIQGHTHTDACYTAGESVLTCELEERETAELVCGQEETTAHIHEETCYSEAGEKTLTCELEEHTHEKICYSDKTADVETAEIWERTLADVELTEVWADDLLAIAESQLGYTESTKNYIVTEDGETKGYTRYGDWYGDDYGDWCAMFVSFCLHYAEVDSKLMPQHHNCEQWIEVLEKKEYKLYREANAYTPVSGDVIFFDWNEDGKSEHVGLVAELIEATETESAKIKTIEGNSSNQVKYNTYELNDPIILGYGVLPENPELMPIEQKLTATIYTDASYAKSANDATVITVSGVMPQDAEVRAYPVELETELEVVCAYDIEIIQADGTIYEPGENLKVSIQPGDLDPETDLQVYYVPEEGEPEQISTEITEEGISFDTDHFSVYALAVSGTNNRVYLNGVSGNDDAAGTQNAPVKTIERACELVKENGTIYISGTVTIDDAADWNLPDATIQRASSFTEPLIIISSGGSLDLSDITIHGGSDTPNSSNIATNSSYASDNAKAPLIVVNTGGRLAIHDGTLLTNNSNKPDTNQSGQFKENGYVGQGGAIYCNGTLTMDGGTIQYCEAESGGGVYIENGIFNLSGGTIDHNYARDVVASSKRKDSYHKNAGGGVYVGDNSTMNMSGGTISNNQTSREGGGVSLGWLNRTNGTAISEFITTFNMTGGTFTRNTATSTGGGLNITAGRQAFITAGTFTNNTANGREYQPSSGYSAPSNVYSGGAIYLDAQQTDSRGNYSGKPGYAVIHRVLITDNTATNNGGGIACCGTSTISLNASVDLRNGTAIYNNNATNSGEELYLYGTVNLVSETVLGGGEYDWEKSGYAYDNDLTDNSAAIIEAKKLATVIITGNTAHTGGGIGCNGVIEIGGEEESTSLVITKEWENTAGAELPDYIEVQIYQDGAPYGDPIRIYPAADGTWPSYYMDGLPAGHTYTISEIEVPGFISTVTKNGNAFTITNTRPLTTISAEKCWAGEGEHPDAVQLQLLADGVPYGDPVTLNSSNNWFYQWQELPKLNADGSEIVYSVSELNAENYDVSIEQTERTEDGKTVTAWEQVTTLESGKKYLFVSSSGALAANGTSSLQWMDVSDSLENGTLPGDTALWTYQNQKLQNSSNRKYLYIQNYKNNVSLSNSGSAVKYTDGYLQISSRYLSGLSSTTSNSSSAMKFTAYVQVSQTAEATTNMHFIVTNTKKPDRITVNFAKHATGTDGNGTSVKLAGAELALYQQDANSQTVIPGTDVTGTLLGEWTSEDAGSASKGIQTYSLSDGTYYLIETKAPDGYIGLSEPIIFTVNAASGTVDILQYPDHDVSIPAGNTVDFPIYNTATYALPETGGAGTTIYTTAGLALAISGMAGLMYIQTKRKREGV